MEHCRLIDFTTVISVDKKHSYELEIVYPTWKALKPEIFNRPMHVYCDDAQDSDWWSHRLSFINHDNLRLFQWSAPPEWTQREKMLAALIYGPAQTVETKWFVKIDVDSVATATGEWMLDWWTDGNPAFISSPWSYTRPGLWYESLDRWANCIPELACNKPPHRRIVGGIAKARRIISWLFIGNSEWNRKLAKWCGDRLPVPSQDTTVFYAASREGHFYRRIQFKHHGWRHVGGGGVDRLRAAVAAALGPAGVAG